VGDEADPFSAAHQSAELAMNAFMSQRSFGCGSAALSLLAVSPVLRDAVRQPDLRKNCPFHAAPLAS